MTTTYFTYSDPRYGDTYEVYIDHEGHFHSARRSTGPLSRDATYYYDLMDIPAYHRNEIVGLISERQKKTNGN